MRHHKHNTGLNLAVRGLHDELKGLVLTCAANFPKEARGGLKFVADVVDLQGMIASYNRTGSRSPISIGQQRRICFRNPRYSQQIPRSLAGTRTAPEAGA